MTDPTHSDALLNRAAGLLAAVAEINIDVISPAISLRCMLAVRLLARAGAHPDPLPTPAHPSAITAAVGEALHLLSRLPAAVFDTEPVLEAVTEVMLAYEATG